jgi:hypothetical protein
MRASARVALLSITVFAGLGLAGCASVDELKDSMTGWFSTGKSKIGQGALLDDLAETNDKAPPDRMPREQASKAPKNRDKQAGKRQRNQTVDVPNKPAMSASAEAVKPKRADAQSASSQAGPTRLPTLWPDAPRPGAFSR